MKPIQPPLSVLPTTIAAHLGRLDDEITRADRRQDGPLSETLRTSRAYIEQLCAARLPIDRLLDALRIWRWHGGEILQLPARPDAGAPTFAELIDAALGMPGPKA